MNTSIPSLIDIAPYGSLDEDDVITHFLNKSSNEISFIFINDPSVVLEYIYNFMWMGKTGFIYYLPAIMPYLEQKLDDDNITLIISSLLTSINFQLENNLGCEKIKNAVLPILEFLQNHIEILDKHVPPSLDSTLNMIDNLDELGLEQYQIDEIKYLMREGEKRGAFKKTKFEKRILKLLKICSSSFTKE